jgi:transcriptional regulator with XRE-family HTH domain
MVKIREIFAKNVRDNRRKCGITQAELAEKADVSTHYIAVIELARNFPKADIIERLAKALDVEIYELFLVPLTPTMEIKKLHKAVMTDLKQIIEETIENALGKRDKKYKN